jgi:hypothetical protein
VFFLYINLFLNFIFFVPSVLVIEKLGINISITLSTTLAAIGLWLGYSKFFGFGVVLISIGLPFSLNATTKIAVTWFGPKGRLFVVAIALLCYNAGFTVFSFLPSSKYKEVQDNVLAYAIVMTCLVPLSFLFIYNKPDFCPTMSEEEKLDKASTLSQDIKRMFANRSLVYMLISCICFFINIHQADRQVIISSGLNGPKQAS